MSYTGAFRQWPKTSFLSFIINTLTFSDFLHEVATALNLKIGQSYIGKIFLFGVFGQKDPKVDPR